MEVKDKSCSIRDMLLYSTGECSTSLVMNSLFGFAMLFYTEALGLTYSWAGLAMGLSALWDAVSDPIMGHISDNTKSKYGRRHPYILWGGFAMAVSFYFLWNVPGIFIENMVLLFWYLVVLNLLLRTAFTVFVIPYVALGFEICQDYTGRTRIQGIRLCFQMAANLCGPALAWSIFFRDQEGTRAVHVVTNFLHMGTWFAVVSLFFVLLVFWGTLKYMKSSHDIKITGNTLKGFVKDIGEILSDRNSLHVFFFMFVVILGVGLVSILQMYLYEHFMKFAGLQKTIVHGGGMIGAGLGALAASYFVSKFGKKGAVFIGSIASAFCHILLAVFFLSGVLAPGDSLRISSFELPVSFIVFALLHIGYWMGYGMVYPIPTSMMADISEINRLKTGINKDGSYSAMLSFSIKFSASIGNFVSGFCLAWIGFVSGGNAVQSDQAVWRLCAVTLLVGPLISLAALILIRNYPIDSEFIQSMRERYNDVENKMIHAYGKG